MEGWQIVVAALISGPGLALLTHALTRESRRSNLKKLQEEVSTAVWKRAKEQLSDYEQTVAELETRLARVQRELFEERGKRRTLENQVRALLAERKQLLDENEALRERVAELERRMGTGPLKED